MSERTNGILAEVNPFDPALTSKPVLFSVGDVTVTERAAPFTTPIEQVTCIALHRRGVWGAVDEIDKLRNEDMVRENGRVVSLYWPRAGLPVYVVTNLRTARTVVMLTEEYQTTDV